MSPIIDNGVILFAGIFPQHTLVGCTGEGDILSGKEYQFSFQPKNKSSGIIVFKNDQGYLLYYQYWWGPDGLTIKYGLQGAEHEYRRLERGVYYEGFCVEISPDFWYASAPPEKNDPHWSKNYVLLDVISILQYIEGRIDLETLRYRAGLYAHKEAMETSRRNAENREREARSELQRIQLLNETFRVGQNLVDSLGWLEAFVTTSIAPTKTEAVKSLESYLAYMALMKNLSESE